MVPIAVIDELDGLKRSSDQHVRGRASRALRAMTKVMGPGSLAGRLSEADFSPIDSGGIPRGEVTVQVLLDPPGHRRLPIADDEIVGHRGTPLRSITQAGNLRHRDADARLRHRADLPGGTFHRTALRSSPVQRQRRSSICQQPYDGDATSGEGSTHRATDLALGCFAEIGQIRPHCRS